MTKIAAKAACVRARSISFLPFPSLFKGPFSLLSLTYAQAAVAADLQTGHFVGDADLRSSQWGQVAIPQWRIIGKRR